MMERAAARTREKAGRRRLWRDRSGNVATEFALLAPVLLTIVVAGLEFGRLMWVISGLHYATEEGARCYAAGLCTASTAVTQAVNVAPEMLFTASDFTAATATCGSGVSGYKVTGTYQFDWVPNSLITIAAPSLTATACFP